MVLTKEELISALQHEVLILVHLAGKVDQTQLDYRPTQIAIIRDGAFHRENMKAAWGPAEARAKTMTLDHAVSAIQA